MSELELELETDAMTEEELLAHEADGDTCDGWAFNFAAQLEDAVVIDVCLTNNSEHCAVYDRQRDIIIDKTFGQFDIGPDLGAWDGDEHPYAMEFEEVYRWEDRDEFEDYYAGMTHAPYIV